MNPFVQNLVLLAGVHYRNALYYMGAVVCIMGFTAFIQYPSKLVTADSTQQEITPMPENVMRQLSGKAFKAGEKLEFRVHYGWLTAGKAVLELAPEPVKYNGRDCYKILGRGTSASSFNWFFEVDDRFLTMMDKDAIVPWHYRREINEGGYHQIDTAQFDHYNDYVVGKSGGVTVPDNTQDMLTSFYYLRCLDARTAPAGTIFRFPVFMDGEVHNLAIKIIGREVIKTEFGKLRCIKAAPMVVAGRVFKGQEGMYVWVTDDDNLLPVRIESPVIVGSIAADLVSYSHLKHPLKAKVN